MPDTKSITKLITAFLAGGQTPSEGGFAAVNPEEIAQLRGIVDALITAKYAADPDGDLPVEVMLTDRTRYERPLHVVIPYAHKPYMNYSEVERNLLAADRFQGLAQHASDRAARHLRAATMEMQEAAQENRSMSFSGVGYCVPLPAGVTFERIQEELTSQVRKALRKAKCPDDFNERGKWAKACAEAAKKALGVNVQPRTCSVTETGVRAYFDVPTLDKSVKVEMQNP